MPSMCVAFGCDNNGSHQFPQDEVNRRKLRSALKREGFKPSPRSVICKDHFLSTDNGTKSFGSGAPLKRVLKRVTPLWAFSTVKAEKDPKVVERANSLLQGATTKPTMGSNKLKRQCLTYQKQPDGDQLMSTFVHDEATNSSGDTQLFSTSPTETVANEEDTYAFDTVYMVDGNNVEEVEVLEVDSCNTGTMNVKTELLQNSCKKTFKNIPKRKTSIRKRIGPRKKRRNERVKYYNSISGQTSPPITTVDNESTNSQSPELTLPPKKRPYGDQLMSTFVHDEATNSSGDTQLFSTSPTDTVANEEDTYAFDTVNMVDGNNVEEVEVLEVDSCNTGTMNVKTELLQNSCKKTFKNIPKRKTSIRKRIGPRKKRRNERAKYYNSNSGQTSPPITTVDNESTNSQSPELTLP